MSLKNKQKKKRKNKHFISLCLYLFWVQILKYRSCVHLLKIHQQNGTWRVQYLLSCSDSWFIYFIHDWPWLTIFAIFYVIYFLILSQMYKCWTQRLIDFSLFVRSYTTQNSELSFAALAQKKNQNKSKSLIILNQETQRILHQIIYMPCFQLTADWNHLVHAKI